ncbi:N-acetylmuramoyl-L-alanine amidase [Zoogloea sp.]|uniref:N-acetylmuramoyl-L-alanine amidase family protein n=1 Tax=Zoogloea sp. TaxID=49181 RepID=UPI0025FBEEFD|nr:N-acetylmuramoyl-L-alanine amidase [Zoogloea sp.]MCK6396210.1 N-acetylmuramoyl-L-alanine amidase [Zoogloea sp.]
MDGILKPAAGLPLPAGAWRRAAWLALALMATPAIAGVPVAVDVGHYLDKPGATSAYGITEFEYNHALAGVIAARLTTAGTPVRLIGHRGEMADLRARPREAEAAGAGFFLSVHHDSVKEVYLQPWVWQGRPLRHAEGFAGFSLFVSRLNPRLDESLACASAIGAALRRAGLPVATHHGVSSEGVARPWADEANGVYFYDNLVVLKTATVPAVLLEAGVIINRDEERALATPERRALTADAVLDGLQRCGVAAAP